MHRLRRKRRKKKRNIKNSLLMVCMPDMKFYQACIFFLYKEILSIRKNIDKASEWRVKWNTSIELTQ